MRTSFVAFRATLLSPHWAPPVAWECEEITESRIYGNHGIVKKEDGVEFSAPSFCYLHFFSFAIKIGDDGARDVVPHAEDGARDGGEGIGSEMERGQAAGQS